jgi:Fic family protein
MAEDVNAKPGVYRTNMAYLATNPSTILALPPEIPALMERVVDYLNSSSDHDIEVLVNFHMYASFVHPFSDGNGRIIRLVCTFLALSAGYAGFPITKAGREEYLDALRLWEAEPQKFGTLVVEELLQMLPLYERAQKKAAEGNDSRKRTRAFSLF